MRNLCGERRCWHGELEPQGPRGKEIAGEEASLVQAVVLLDGIWARNGQDEAIDDLRIGLCTGFKFWSSVSSVLETKIKNRIFLYPSAT